MTNAEYMRRYNATEKGAAYNRAHVRAWRLANPDKFAEQKKLECEYQKKRRKLNPEKYKLQDFKCDLKRKYGLDIPTYVDMVLSQGYKCAICNEEPKHKHRLHVDHNHTTGKVRKLLCSNCNTALNRLENVVGWSDKAMRYLQEN